MDFIKVFVLLGIWNLNFLSFFAGLFTANLSSTRLERMSNVIINITISNDKWWIFHVKFRYEIFLSFCLKMAINELIVDKRRASRFTKVGIFLRKIQESRSEKKSFRVGRWMEHEWKINHFSLISLIVSMATYF